MNEQNTSCIIAQFEQFADLNSAERELLRALEKDAREYPANSVIVRDGECAKHFFTLMKGWACAVRELADGQRQVLDIFLPGQIMGLRDIGFDRNLTELRTITNVTACPFPRQRLTDIFDSAPRLTDIFFLILAREQSMLVERIINIGRRNAAERLAHFLIEMKVRLNSETTIFEMPLNQSVIGDALSLSSVHVSRTFGKLRKDGMIETDCSNVRICDLERLIDFASFDRTYLQIHSDWARQRRQV